MRAILSYVRRAAEDFNMISEGDKILIGLSGGKDSLTLMCALGRLRHFYPKRFEICAALFDMGFPGADYTGLKAICDREEIPFIIKKSSAADIIFNLRREKNPCSLCARLRRGAINNIAAENGFNKVALAHHRDDAVETFFLNLFYEGRIGCFSPVSYLNRKKITIIRPLIYLSEEKISSFATGAGLETVKNPCPVDGRTKRQYIKGLLNELDGANRGLKKRLFTAISRDLPEWRAGAENMEDD